MRTNLQQFEVVLRRTVVFALTLGMTGAATWQMRALLEIGGLTALDTALLVLFAVSFLWLSFAFWTGLAGAAVLILQRRQPGLNAIGPEAQGPLPNRTAILMPIYNEDPARVFANVQAMYEELDGQGQLAAFDFYILSDTQEPGRWIEEEVAWSALVARLRAAGRIFYRKRPRNYARKAGNIADFCKRWGGNYAYMVVLDADSLMTGATLIRMARLMDENPRAGLIQVPPVMVGRNTLFGRIVQFAAGVYGPMFAAGMAFWSVSEGNYWGHNAIIRTGAFAASAGLPELPGRPPFGGHILSHDFVEAALLRRAGWEVWMAYELDGSYEEAPPNLLDYVKRDRRWCQGNLQHASILVARDLHWVSRLHFAIGISGYLISPVWLAFLFLSVASAVVHALTPPVYFPEGRPTLFPEWPVWDAALSQLLLYAVFGMLMIPRAMAILILAVRGKLAQFGGFWRVAASAVAEIGLTTLAAPVMMIFQSRFVAEILLGRDSGWQSPSRDDGEIAWDEAFRRHWLHMTIALVIASLAVAYAPEMLFWLAPIVLALALSAPTAWAMSLTGLGVMSRRFGLFVIPEETAPPPVLRRAVALLDELRRDRRPGGDALAQVVTDPLAHAVHMSLLPVNAAWYEPDPDVRDLARFKIWKTGNRLQDARLKRDETVALLLDREALEALHDRALIDGARDARKAAE